MGALLAAWLAEVGIITWRDVTNKVPNHTIGGLPLPADYLATFAVYGTLGLVPRGNAGATKVAAAIGWGFVVATLLNAVNPSNPANPFGSNTAAATPSTTKSSAKAPAKGQVTA